MVQMALVIAGQSKVNGYICLTESVHTTPVRMPIAVKFLSEKCSNLWGNLKAIPSPSIKIGFRIS